MITASTAAAPFSPFIVVWCAAALLSVCYSDRHAAVIARTTDGRLQHIQVSLPAASPPAAECQDLLNAARVLAACMLTCFHMAFASCCLPVAGIHCFSFAMLMVVDVMGIA